MFIPHDAMFAHCWHGSVELSLWSLGVQCCSLSPNPWRMCPHPLARRPRPAKYPAIHFDINQNIWDPFMSGAAAPAAPRLLTLLFVSPASDAAMETRGRSTPHLASAGPRKIKCPHPLVWALLLFGLSMTNRSSGSWIYMCLGNFLDLDDRLGQVWRLGSPSRDLVTTNYRI